MVKYDLQQIFFPFKLTFQETRKLQEIFDDLHMWEIDINQIVPQIDKTTIPNKADKQRVLKEVEQNYQELKNNLREYKSSTNPLYLNNQMTIEINPSERKILGKCPVDSVKTRCCQLITLDAVMSCGFDCTYCSIQSFYNNGKIQFDPLLKEKLEQIKLDPNKYYHIGTGQSSDSLLWGNHNELLSNLLHFAQTHPNVILEFKSKSDNIKPLLELEIPKNCIFTWSLNPQNVIDQEERFTASLENRIESAIKVANAGNLVGFHFHPMIYYKNYQLEYKKIVEKILKNFNPSQVAMISFGTLTFTKKVIKQIRKRSQKTKILMMPMSEDSGGKLSYPLNIKAEMFSFIYQQFGPWHNKVFFYLCMEDPSLWPIVFNKEYISNDQFEEDMINSYLQKISNPPK